MRIAAATVLAIAGLVFAVPVKAAGIAPDILRELAPTGKLRAAMNFGNPVLAVKDPATGEPRGVSADLARELGRRLDLEVVFVPFDSAGMTVDAVKRGEWDVAFLAIDPLRAQEIIFSKPYVTIEGVYMVRADAPYKSSEEIDAQGVRIVVGKGSAYDLYLRRSLKQATLVEAPTSAAALETFAAGGAFEAAAGVREAVEAFARDRPALRIVPGRFMAINQAMAVPAGRPQAARIVEDFIEQMRTSGFVARALVASGQSVAIATPAPAR